MRRSLTKNDKQAMFMYRNKMRRCISRKREARERERERERDRVLFKIKFEETIHVAFIATDICEKRIFQMTSYIVEYICVHH